MFQQRPTYNDLRCDNFSFNIYIFFFFSRYESSENMTITCSTKVCSFGKQVVEKVETEYARFENGRFVYRIHRSPMCEYMINFIHKLKHLPEKYMMNSVLENFTILQVISCFICKQFKCISYDLVGLSLGGYQPRDPRDFTLYCICL